MPISAGAGIGVTATIPPRRRRVRRVTAAAEAGVKKVPVRAHTRVVVKPQVSGPPRPSAQKVAQMREQQIEGNKVRARERTRAHYAQLKQNAQAKRDAAKLRGAKGTASARTSDLDAALSFAKRAARFSATGSTEAPRRVKRSTRLSIGATVAPGVPQVSAGKIFQQAADVGQAFYEKPGQTSKKTASGARDAVLGVPGAVISTATHPVHTVEQLAKDYGRRYGKAGTRANVERIQREGAAPEILDAAAIGSAGGSVAGRLLGAGARRGALGVKAQRVAATPRPDLRISGGLARKQNVSPNLFVATAQRGQDAARAWRTDRRGAKARGNQEPKEIIQPQTAYVRKGIVPERSGGEVTPFSRHYQARVQRRAVAKVKSRAVQAMKQEQHREVGGAVKEIAPLNRHEKAAFNYAAAGIVPVEPAAAKTALRKRRVQIQAERTRTGATVPRVRTKTNDEVRKIDDLLEHADKAFTPRLRESVGKVREREHRVAAKDPTLVDDQVLLRRYAQQAETLGVYRRKGEQPRQFVQRVHAEARRKGHADPLYIPSVKRSGGPMSGEFADYAVGGMKAAKGDKKYTGALYRTGRQDTRPEVVVQGLARGIKRKHNHELVREQFNQHTFEWGRNKKVGEILDELDRRGLNPSDVALWNPGKFDEVGRRKIKQEATGAEEAGDPAVGKAVSESHVLGEDAVARRAELEKTGGWHALPHAAFEEIKGEARPSGITGRSLDVLKGKQARIMLGTSPPWLAAQVASNTFLTGFGVRGNLGDIAKAQVWWKKLDAEERNAISPFLGTSAFGRELQQTKLGAATNNQFVNAYRAFKQSAFFHTGVARGRGPSVAQLNPLDMLFRADNAQNNLFRRAVLYNSLKREAYQRIGQNAGEAAKLQERITGVLGLGPREQISALAKDRPTLERHAQRVDDILGDYITYTNKERRFFNRSVMFGGFLRYSLRLVFYTMPAKHPVMSSVLGKLGQMQTEEVKKLLGPGAQPWMLGRYYYSTGGKLKEINIASANPAMNAVTNIQGINQVATILPPVFQQAIEQITSKKLFQDRPFLIKGEKKYEAVSRKSKDYPLSDRARISLNDTLGLAWPYRTAQKIAEKGAPHGDDSLLGSPRPTIYKRADIVGNIKKRAGESPQGFEAWLREIAPLIPHPAKKPVNVPQGPVKKKKKVKKTSDTWDSWGGGGSSKKSSGATWDSPNF